MNGPKMDFIRPTKSLSSAFNSFFKSTSSVAKISGIINSSNDHSSCNHKDKCQTNDTDTGLNTREKDLILQVKNVAQPRRPPRALPSSSCEAHSTLAQNELVYHRCYIIIWKAMWKIPNSNILFLAFDEHKAFFHIRRPLPNIATRLHFSCRQEGIDNKPFIQEKKLSNGCNL